MSWGLVLSGGAAYGLANAGVLEVLEHERLRPDCIAGSSMGAIVAALYALGYSTAELRSLTKELKTRNIAKLSDKLFSGGLHGGFFRQRLEERLQQLVGNAYIGDCAIPFVCIAGKVKQPIKWRKIIKDGFTDHVRTAVELCIFDKETRILDALMATSAIPVVFSPYEINGVEFVDLCHFGPIPARSLRKTHHPDIVVATHTAPEYATLKRMLPPAWQEFLQAGYRETEESVSACNFIIRPAMSAPPYRFDRVEDFWRAGRTAAEKCVPELHALLR